MARSKKPRKMYRPKTTELHMMFKSYAVLEPMMKVIDQLEKNGTIDTVKGNAVIVAADEMYDTHAALGGLIHHFEIFELRYQVHLPLEPFREFHRGLPYQMPVTESLLKRMKDSIAPLQRFLAWQTSEEAADIVKTVQVAAELEGKK